MEDGNENLYRDLNECGRSNKVKEVKEYEVLACENSKF